METLVYGRTSRYGGATEKPFGGLKLVKEKHQENRYQTPASSRMPFAAEQLKPLLIPQEAHLPPMLLQMGHGLTALSRNSLAHGYAAHMALSCSTASSELALWLRNSQRHRTSEQIQSPPT